MRILTSPKCISVAMFKNLFQLISASTNKRRKEDMDKAFKTLNMYGVSTTLVFSTLVQWGEKPPTFRIEDGMVYISNEWDVHQNAVVFKFISTPTFSGQITTDINLKLFSFRN